VPMLCERASLRAVIVLAYSPHVVRRYDTYAREFTTAPIIGAWYYAPYTPVPVLCERASLRAVIVLAYSPHIASRHCSYSIEVATVRAHVGAWHHRPGSAVPVLNKRLKCECAAIVTIGTHSPHIVGRYCCNSIEAVGARTGAGTGNHRPSCAVP